MTTQSSGPLVDKPQIAQTIAQPTAIIRLTIPREEIRSASGEKGFAENAWVGHTLAIGTAVRLNITGPCWRCVMTTLAQGDLAMDPGILRTAARHNLVNVGVYAAVVRDGTIRRGDPLRLE